MTTTSPSDAGRIPERPPGIPVTLLTGFLGSGKTTLLNRLLHDPRLTDTAVIVNEFGEIGLDHHFVEASSADMVVMNSGCLCCTVRGDLVDTMRRLYMQRVRGEVPQFRRVIIETTGLADPAPILHTLMEDPLLEAYYRLDGVVTTVDAVNGASQLEAQFESVKQAAVADRIVLTKTDLAASDRSKALQARLGRLNPGAPVIVAVNGAADPSDLLETGLWNPETKIADVKRWLHEEAYSGHGHDHHDHSHESDHGHGGRDQDPHDVNRHDRRIRAHCLVVEEPLEWDAFAMWLGSLIRMRGDDMLRIKGVLNVRGEAGPIALHGVQQVFHPPARLPEWPDDDRRSKLVFITRDIERAFLERSLNAYRDATAAPPTTPPTENL
ncbi:MAG TPA: GTP-binding protein [Alphaproteobacteria bacterium]|nr:GTP-binding protein [Alphaproteobacteria bacterium]